MLDDPDIRERYCGLLRTGSPRHLAARQLGLSYKQIQRHAATHSDFADAIADAKGEGVDPLYSKAYELALGVDCTCGGGQAEHSIGREGNRGAVVMVHEPRCAFMPPDPQMLTFMLKSLDPETFGNRITVEHEHKIELGSATALLELEERLLRRQRELGGGQAVVELGPGAFRES